jgi:LPXTG-site transpeptidase (sortase) family protein
MNKIANRSKFIASVILLSLGIITVLFWDSGETLNGSFTSEPIIASGLKAETTLTGHAPQRILIADLNIDLYVKPARVINGFWEVFPDSAGWGEGSGIPGKTGNQIIFAHARENLFLKLGEARPGMKIVVTNDIGIYEYLVNKITEVYPSNTEVIAQTADETLTLYTCSGFDDSKRLIVSAHRV